MLFFSVFKSCSADVLICQKGGFNGDSLQALATVEGVLSDGLHLRTQRELFELDAVPEGGCTNLLQLAHDREGFQYLAAAERRITNCDHTRATLDGLKRSAGGKSVLANGLHILSDGDG